MKYFFWLLVPVAFAGSISSCRSTKRIQTAISKKDTAMIVPVGDARADSMRFISEIYQAIEKNRIDFNTFSAKVKVDFTGSDGKKPDFTANIRIKKDSAIWVSITALLGIEAFRLLVTPDSVKLLHKLDKTVQLRSVSYLQELAKIPFTFHELQELLIGNPVFLDSNIVSYRKDEKSISLLSASDLFKHLLTVSNDDYRLLHSKLDDADVLRNRTCNISYGDYVNKNGLLFPTARSITVVEKTKLDIGLQFKQVDFNVDLTFPFNIPRNYKRQ
jgi:hypothetical protein